MNQNQYLKAVSKRLKCSSAKKKEIMKQIQSDISIAMESGKSFDDVMAEMGKPTEAAAEFNDNFSEEETRRAKRQKWFKISGIAVCVLIVLAAGVFWLLPKVNTISGSAAFSEEAVTAKAKEVIALLDEDDLEALKPLMTEQMQEVLTEDVWQEVRAMFGGDFGAFGSWGNSYAVEMEQAGQKMAVIEIAASYENVTVIYQLSFDKNMRLAGFYVR